MHSSLLHPNKLLSPLNKTYYILQTKEESSRFPQKYFTRRRRRQDQPRAQRSSTKLSVTMYSDAMTVNRSIESVTTYRDVTMY